MRTLLNLLLPGLLITHTAIAAPDLILPQHLFQQPNFAKEFVGSYGILSDVEPKVSDAEQQLLGRLQTLFSESKFKDAENLLVAFIKEVEKPTDPERAAGEISPALVFVLGNLYFQSERLDEAKRAFQEAIKRFPKFRRAHTNLGYVAISTNKVDEALASFQKAVGLGETSPRVMGMLGYCYLAKQNPLAAENAYRQAYLIDPDSSEWKLGLAQSLLMQEKFAEAASMFGVLIRENPQDKQLWMRQTSAWLALDRKEEAILNLETLRLMGLADENNLNLLGNIYLDQAQPKLALDAYSAAMDRAATLNIAQALKSAKILNDFGFSEQSAELLKKIRTAAPKLMGAERLLLDLTEVKVARALKKNAEALAILKQLAADVPGNPEVMLEIGKHYDMVARDEVDEEKAKLAVAEAKTHYQLALANDTTAQQANLAFGQLLIRENRPQDALIYLEKALQLKKSEPLEQYISRVRRAADREKVRKDREEAQRAAEAAKPTNK
jgi:tetratricopeptide (TPR) repeat protein